MHCASQSSGGMLAWRAAVFDPPGDACSNACSLGWGWAVSFFFFFFTGSPTWHTWVETLSRRPVEQNMCNKMITVVSCCCHGRQGLPTKPRPKFTLDTSSPSNVSRVKFRPTPSPARRSIRHVFLISCLNPLLAALAFCCTNQHGRLQLRGRGDVLPDPDKRVQSARMIQCLNMSP